MNDAEEAQRRAVALFRYRLIADLAHQPPGAAGIGEQLRAKAAQTYDIPGTLRTSVAAEMLRDWLHAYRLGGFDALYPKPRADRGRPRRLPPQAAELLIALKTEHPSWSVGLVGAGATGVQLLLEALEFGLVDAGRLLDGRPRDIALQKSFNGAQDAFLTALPAALLTASLLYLFHVSHKLSSTTGHVAPQRCPERSQPFLRLRRQHVLHVPRQHLHLSLRRHLSHQHRTNDHRTDHRTVPARQGAAGLRRAASGVPRHFTDRAALVIGSPLVSVMPTMDRS